MQGWTNKSQTKAECPFFYPKKNLFFFFKIERQRDGGEKKENRGEKTLEVEKCPHVPLEKRRKMKRKEHKIKSWDQDIGSIDK